VRVGMKAKIISEYITNGNGEEWPGKEKKEK
jgi:hypothetical protein